MRMFKTYSAIVLIAIVLIVGLIIVIDKPDINTATIEELENIHGIGPILAERVGSYLKLNPEADIDELVKVHGIGEKRLDILKGCYD